MRPTLVCCSGPYQRRHRPQEQQNGDGLLYKWTILNYSFEQKALSSFDLSISRGGPGNTGRGPFCGSNRARFAPEIVGILGPRGPRPAGKDIRAITSLPILSVHYRSRYLLLPPLDVLWRGARCPEAFRSSPHIPPPHAPWLFARIINWLEPEPKPVMMSDRSRGFPRARQGRAAGRAQVGYAVFVHPH